MNEERWKQAEALASRPYTFQVRQAESTEDEPMFLAKTLELPECHAQGETREEAIENLKSALIDFIYFLLEDGLPVPDPVQYAVATTSTAPALRPSSLVWQNDQWSTQENSRIPSIFIEYP